MENPDIPQNSNSTSNYRKMFIAIGILSALVFLWAHTPFNHHRTNLMDITAGKVAPFPNTSLSVHGATSSDLKIEASCNITNLDQPNHCGFSIPLLADDNHPIFSFDKADHIQIKVHASSSSPLYDGRVRVTIKSVFDETDTAPLTNASLKHHSVRVESGQFDIPIERFNVDTWWKDTYAIRYHEANADFNNIHSVNVLINDAPIKHAGNYQISLSKLEVEGYLIKPQTVNNWLIFFWLIVGVGSLLYFSWHGHGTLQRMRRVTYYDPDTDLLNEEGFRDYIKSLAPSSGGAIYLFRFDNASILEHHFGDKVYSQLIMKTKARLLSVFQSQSIKLARLSHSELVMFCPTGKLAREKLLERIFSEGVEMIGVGHLKLDVSASYVLEPSIAKELDAAFEKCRFVLDQPYELGSFIREYSSAHIAPLKQKASVEYALTRCIAEDGFYLLFMPLYDSAKGRVVGAEALLRSTFDSLSRLSPEVYIPIAEKANLIQEIDMLVLKKALNMLKQYDLPEDFVLSINISAQELLDSEFAQRIDKSLHNSGVPASSICLEVTETFFIHMDDAKVEVLEQLHKMGCRISLDDFGTGYTSFAHLQRLEVDEIKIDRSFVMRLDDPKTRVVVESMINIAKTLGYKLVAEGVETEEQMIYLQTLGCNCFQGYFFSKPTSLKQALQSQPGTQQED